MGRWGYVEVGTPGARGVGTIPIPGLVSDILITSSSCLLACTTDPGPCDLGGKGWVVHLGTENGLKTAFGSPREPQNGPNAAFEDPHGPQKWLLGVHVDPQMI